MTLRAISRKDVLFPRKFTPSIASHADVLRGSVRVPVRGAGTRDEP